MYVMETRNPVEFIEAARKSEQAVRVSERPVALPVREQGGVIVHAALERHYTVDAMDPLQGETRLIFTEHVVERGNEFPFETSLFEALKNDPDLRDRVSPSGRISGPA